MQILTFQKWLSIFEANEDLPVSQQKPYSELYDVFSEYVLGNAERMRFNSEKADKFVNLLKADGTVHNESIKFLRDRKVKTLYRGIDENFDPDYLNKNDELGELQSWTYDQKTAYSFGQTVLIISLEEAIPYLMCSAEYMVNRFGEPFSKEKLRKTLKEDRLGEDLDDEESVAFMAAIQKEVILYKVPHEKIKFPGKTDFIKRMDALAAELSKIETSPEFQKKYPYYRKTLLVANVKKTKTFGFIHFHYDNIEVWIEQFAKDNNKISYGYSIFPDSSKVIKLPPIEYDESSLPEIARYIVQSAVDDYKSRTDRDSNPR